MLLLLLFLLALPVFLLFLLQKLRKDGETLRRPPRPGGLPLIGNLHQLDNSALHHHLWQLSRKYGPLMSLKFGCKPTLVVSSAKMAKEVMKTHDLAFCSRPALLGQQKLSYQGLDIAFAPYNDNWRMLRKICTLHLFNLKSSQSFRPIREDEVSQMIAKITEVSVSSKLVNLSEVTMTLTGNIICRVAFGKRYDEGYERSRFRGLLMETQAMFLSFFVSDYFPSIGWVDKLTGLWARLEKNFKDMDLFYQELIDEHLDPMRPKSKLKDIIDILLQLRKVEQSSFEITFDHIKAVVMVN